MEADVEHSMGTLHRVWDWEAVWHLASHEGGVHNHVPQRVGGAVYCMVVALGGYGWYLLDMDGIWNSVDAV